MRPGSQTMFGLLAVMFLGSPGSMLPPSRILWPMVGSRVYVSAGLFRVDPWNIAPVPRVPDISSVPVQLPTGQTVVVPAGNNPPGGDNPPESLDSFDQRRSASESAVPACVPMEVTHIGKDTLRLRDPSTRRKYELKSNWRDITHFTQEECIKARKDSLTQTQPIRNNETEPARK